MVFSLHTIPVILDLLATEAYSPVVRVVQPNLQEMQLRVVVLEASLVEDLIGRTLMLQPMQQEMLHLTQMLLLIPDTVH